MAEKRIKRNAKTPRGVPLGMEEQGAVSDAARGYCASLRPPLEVLPDPVPPISPPSSPPSSPASSSPPPPSLSVSPPSERVRSHSTTPAVQHPARSPPRAIAKAAASDGGLSKSAPGAVLSGAPSRRKKRPQSFSQRNGLAVGVPSLTLAAKSSASVSALVSPPRCRSPLAAGRSAPSLRRSVGEAALGSWTATASGARFNLSEIYAGIKDAGLISDRVIGKKACAQCLQGAEFVEWAIQPPMNVPCRKEAEELGCQMVLQGMLVSVNPKRYMDFHGDKQHYYRLSWIPTNRDYNVQRTRSGSLDTAVDEAKVVEEGGRRSPEGSGKKRNRVRSFMGSPLSRLRGRGSRSFGDSADERRVSTTTSEEREERDGPERTVGRKRSLEFLARVLRPSNMKPLRRVVLESTPITKALIDAATDIELLQHIPSALVTVYLKGENPFLIPYAIANEVTDTENVALLFRSDTKFVRMISKCTQILGGQFLDKTVKLLVKKVLRRPGSLEIDPERMTGIEQLHQNRVNLAGLCDEIIEDLHQSVPSLPFKLRELFLLLHSTVEQKFADHGPIAVGSCFMLRFVVPAMVASPSKGQKEISLEDRRKLVLVSKVLQCIANETDFTEQKDPIMNVVQRYIVNSVPKMRALYDALIELDLAFEPEDEVHVSDDEEDDALISLYYYIITQKQQILEALRRNFDAPAEAEKHIALLEEAIDKVS